MDAHADARDIRACAGAICSLAGVDAYGATERVTHADGLIAVMERCNKNAEAGIVMLSAALIIAGAVVGLAGFWWGLLCFGVEMFAFSLCFMGEGKS